MRTDEIRKLTKNMLVMFDGHQCLLHPCNERVYLLSNLKQFQGRICEDFYLYESQYRYSFWLANITNNNCDNRFARICQQLIPYSLGGL